MIRQLQDDHRVWLLKNFPGQQAHQPLLGLTEEVGELSHAHLKGEQGIRGMGDDGSCRAAKIDAVGDIFVYLMSYCNSNGIDLESAVVDTWWRVRSRDWKADPQAGGE